MSDESNLSDLLTGARRHANAWVGAADAATGGMISSSLGLMPWSSMAEEKRKAAEAQDDFRQLYGRAGRDALAATQNPTNPARAFAHAGSTLADILQHAMFLGPLAPLDKIRKSGEWGHPSRVEAAQAALKEGRPAEEVWKEHGWLPVKDVLRSGSNDLPVTMVDPNGLKMRPWDERGKLRQGNGEYLESWFSWPEAEKMFPQAFDRSIPVKFDMGSPVPAPKGATVIGGAGSKDFLQAFSGNGRPLPGVGMVGIHYAAPGEKMMTAGLAHEGTHLGALLDPSGVPNGSSNRYAPSVWNTEASQEALRKAEAAIRAENEWTRETGGSYSAAVAAARRAEEEATQTARHSGYVQDEGERLARLSAIYNYYGIDPKGVPPSTMSAYGWRAAEPLGVPDDFLAKFRPLPEGTPLLSPSQILRSHSLTE